MRRETAGVEAIRDIRHAGRPVASRRVFRTATAAARLDDLRIPPGSRSELLSGDRSEQYSIRVNDQCRVTLRWKDGNADEVAIEDYQ